MSPSDSWLDALPPGPRRVLLGVTGVVLASATALSGIVAPPATDALALGAVLGLAGAWIGAWAWLGRPARRAEREGPPVTARDRGLLVSSAASPAPSGPQALSARDPAFSLPALHDLVLALHRATPGAPDLVHGPTRVLDVRIEPDRTRLSVLVRARAPDGAVCRILRLSRAAGAVSPAPEAVAAGADGGWRLDGAEDVQPPPEPPIVPDPAVPAARRALLLRAEAFDLDAFEALLAEIDAALDAARPEAVEPYATAAGAECVRWWAEGEGLPPTGAGTAWLAVEEDGWTERIEVQRGARVLGLLRPSGQPDAPWRLWRLRRAR